MKKFALLATLLLSVPAAANSIEEALCHAASLPVERMETSEKLCRSFSRALLQVPAATAKEASVLLSPENLALMTAMMAAWVGTQGIPIVGQAVDAALLALGVIMIAAQSAELAQSVWKYANMTQSARRHSDLDEAAKHLARAIAIGGVNVVAFILTKRAVRSFRSGSSEPPPSLAPTPEPVVAQSVPGATRPAEFRRYAAILADASTPAVGLEVIINDARAAPFFAGLLRALGIPGEVLVRP